MLPFPPSTASAPTPSKDVAVDEVAEWIAGECKRQKQTPSQLFGAAIRRAVDEVIDGPRTGRWSLNELEKTELTYIGTKVEIIVRTALGLERVKPLDVNIAGHAVDIKFTVRNSWMIPTEAIDQICLVIRFNEDKNACSVGLVRCVRSILGSENKDKKRSLSSSRPEIQWLAKDIPLKPNFIAELNPTVRAKIFNERSSQARIRAFATQVVGVPFPRLAIETVAHTSKDPLRRVREDKGNQLGGMRVLSGRYDNDLITALGYRELESDEFISVRQKDIDNLRRKF